MTLADKLRNPHCKLCPLHEHAQHVCLLGVGSVPASLMLLGEAPGREEDRSGSPFMGKAGGLLDTILNVVGYPRPKVFISNACKCRPLDNKKPTVKQIDICTKTYLTREIKYVKPELIIAMGIPAVQGILQERSVAINNFRNRLWRTEEPFTPGIPVVVTYHPAAALYNPDLIDPIVNDFERAIRILKSGPSPEPKKDYRVVTSFKDMMTEAHKVGRVTVDLETDGLDPYLPGRGIISVQLCVHEERADMALWNPSIALEIAELVQSTRLLKKLHGGKHDIKFLRVAGIKVKPPIDDTLVQIHLLDENFPGKNIETLAAAFTPIKRPHGDLVRYCKEYKCTFRDVPMDVLLDYGCTDVDSTERVSNKLRPRIHEEGLEPLYQLQMKGIRLYAQAEYNGWRVNRNRIQELTGIYEKRISDTVEQLGGLNAKSSQQVSELLYKKWKLPPLGEGKHPRDKVFNTRKQTLNRLLAVTEGEQRRTIATILDVRQARDLLSKNLVGLWDFIRPQDLIHPNYNLTGTLTGRRSCSRPNLQNIPKKADIKSLFVSRYGEAGCILQVDLSNAELRIAAHLSREPTLCAYFKSGNIDVHRKVSARLFKVPESEITDDMRQVGKTIDFGILYGMGSYHMAAMMNRHLEEAKGFISAWKREFKGWPEYQKEQRKKLLKNGYVVSPLGRKRRLTIIDPTTPQSQRAIRQAINSPIQGTVGDWTLFAGYNTWRRIRKSGLRYCHLLGDIHDAWAIDTKRENLEKLVPIIREEFEHPDWSKAGFDFELSIPMKADIAYGSNWLDLQPYTGEN